MPKKTIDFSDQTWGVIEQMANELQDSRADVIRDALSLYWWVFRERKQGSQLLIQRGNKVTEMLPLSLESLTTPPAPPFPLPKTTVEHVKG